MIKTSLAWVEKAAEEEEGYCFTAGRMGLLPLPINCSYWRDFSEEQLEFFADEIFTHYRIAGFPFHCKSLREQKQALRDMGDFFAKNCLIQKDGIIQQTMHCLSTAWTYFPHAWEIRCGKMRTPMEVFNDAASFKKLIRKQLRMATFIGNTRIRSRLNNFTGTQNVSNFRPSAARAIYDEFLEKLKREGGYVIEGQDKEKLQRVLWHDGHLNPGIVAQHAVSITGQAGIDLPEGKQFLIVPETGTGPDYPFSGEKLTVTMALYKVKDIDEAIALTNSIQAYQGQGHSCGIYSRNDDNIMKLALATRTSRVMVNQPQAASNSGNLWNGMRQTFSLGCGSWGGNSINHNITWRDLINETWVSRPLAKTKVIPSDDELFGSVMGKF